MVENYDSHATDAHLHLNLTVQQHWGQMCLFVHSIDCVHSWFYMLLLSFWSFPTATGGVLCHYKECTSVCVWFPPLYLYVSESLNRFHGDTLDGYFKGQNLLQMPRTILPAKTWLYCAALWPKSILTHTWDIDEWKVDGKVWRKIFIKIIAHLKHCLHLTKCD